MAVQDSARPRWGRPAAQHLGCRRARAGAATQHLGCRRADPGDRRHGADCLWRRADHGAAVDARGHPGLARPGQPAALCAAHHDADAAGDRLLDHLHLCLCRPRRQEPARRNGADPAARHPAVGADPRLSDLHGRVLHEPVSRPGVRRRTRLRVRDLHQPGLEHDLQHVPVDPQRTEGPGRSLAELSPRRLAALLAAGRALRHAGPDLEHHDVDVGRLVFRGRLRSDHGRQYHGGAARDRLLCRARHSKAGPARDRLRDPDHASRHHRL